ncbi:helix-turn-helix domain-containing protein [Actinomadura fulvescens]|uniref:Helix-turn-helix domain-containing protein n=1 Tax=Actinomadura fulvescens TaxID=46160 RepID=A0ABN3QBJ2_9ACTN
MADSPSPHVPDAQEQPTGIPDLQKRPTLTVPEAGRVLGLSRAAAYEAAKRGDLPTLRIGRRMVVPTAHLLGMLGLIPDPAQQRRDA